MTIPATVDALFTALHRESELVADSIGIPLTADELRQVKERLILTWVVEHLTGHEMLSVGDLLRRYPGDDEAQSEAQGGAQQKSIRDLAQMQHDWLHRGFSQRQMKEVYGE